MTKRSLALFLCFLMLAALMAGCSKGAVPEPTSEATPAPTASAVPDATEEPEASEEPEETAEPEPTDEPETSPEPEKWFTFQPKISSSFIEEVYGKEKIETWFSIVDAVMEGRDTFSCPNGHVYLWTLRDFPHLCYPVMDAIIKQPDDYDFASVNGTAQFEYKVSKEEAARLLEEFTALIEGIIYEAIRPEYTPFEKALALYRYFQEHYVYDYETAALVERNDPTANYTTPYRLLTTKTGICSEISQAYSYILLQLGVEAATVSSWHHEWSIIKLGDHYYHIDPTWVINDWDNMAYFMMTEEKRRAGQSFADEEFKYVGEYSPEEMPEFPADDETFAQIWDYHLDAFNPETDTLTLKRYIGDDSDDTEEFDIITFSYSPY